MMILTHTGIYALRAMAYLATCGEGVFVSSATLAADTHVPASYLSKIMRRLVRAKLVLSRKGHSGGFALAVSAEEVSFNDILLATGFSSVRGRCFFGQRDCDPKNPCLLHFFWDDLQRSFQQWAEKTTLADVRQANTPAYLWPDILPPAST
jgi:Rrf2 family protein